MTYEYSLPMVSAHDARIWEESSLPIGGFNWMDYQECCLVILLKPRSHIHVCGYGPRGLITDREVTDETCSSSPVLAGKHVPTVRVRKTRTVGRFDQGNSGLYHGLPWCHR